jgi:glycosyltransferase involved in cell wall biosynthesis
MKILHYSLGLPPYRTGGLTKYAYDLMLEQVKNKHHVTLLYPGHYRLFNKPAIIRNSSHLGIYVYEILNPLPVSLLGGINKPELFMKTADKSIFIDLLNKIDPEIIHIHTLMGLHKEFLEAAKELGIKMLFTTHDYFGLCLKVNRIDYQHRLCENDCDIETCVLCNHNGYSLNLIYLMQSRLYRHLKDTGIIRKLRNYKKNSHRNQKVIYKPSIPIQVSDMKSFEQLRCYYRRMFELIDCYHFNSSVAKGEFNKSLQLDGEVVHITHNKINDNRCRKVFDPQSDLRISYLGPIEAYKGFFLLKECLNTLVESGIKGWKLNVYGDARIPESDFEKTFISYHGKYEYSYLEQIFQSTDVLVIPSVWKETFGYIGLEALSYGVPIIVTENVGFKDLLVNGKTGIVVKPKAEYITKILYEIITNRKILEDINENILNIEFKFSIEYHVKQMMSLYNTICKGKGLDE